MGCLPSTGSMAVIDQGRPARVGHLYSIEG
jgi:hypothetical protein